MSTESTNKLATEFFEVVDIRLNIQYDELACLRAGRIAIVAECFRPAFSSSLSCESEKRIWTNFRIISIYLGESTDPTIDRWGPGSRLVFRAAMYHLKPVFVAAQDPPPESVHYRLLPADLFGVLRGYWAVPHPFGDGGPCDDEY